jgi:transmembrane sensor
VNVSWRTLAAQGKHQQAYSAVQKLPPSQLRDADDLVAAAEVARLSGHPMDAVPFLKRVLREFRSDPNAPIAAFALGRILLPVQPRRAATNFALARRLSPQGALSEDALAREAEAWARAGDQPQARRTARRYLRQYPRGSRAEMMKRYGSP